MRWLSNKKNLIVTDANNITHPFILLAQVGHTGNERWHRYEVVAQITAGDKGIGRCETYPGNDTDKTR